MAEINRTLLPYFTEAQIFKYLSTQSLLALFQWLSSFSIVLFPRPALSSAFAVRSILCADLGDTPPHRAFTLCRMRLTCPTLVTPSSW